ncbi:hypothetical protein TNCV_1421031 [Trichonephila clavipes]|nr:hypothetical protein TNCV_1421031 [Trichonephila clavipes]
MSDLSEVKREMIIGVPLAGKCVSSTANLVGVSWITVSRAITAFTQTFAIGRVLECQILTEASHAACLVPTMQYGGSSVMV